MKPHLHITLGLALSFGFALRAQDTESKPEATKPAPAEAADAAPKPEDKPAAKEEPALIGEAPVDLGDFGSDEPIEREDLPNRGILNIPITHELMSNGMHWDQYNITFKTKRWGKYRVRFNYTLKNSTLGVQFKFGETTLKKQLAVSSGPVRRTTMGEIYVPGAGDQFMALYTPQGAGFNTFVLQSIDLIPTSENTPAQQADDAPVELLAKQATTWSENMRYEPKPEKDCLGFWTDASDFAEWEFRAVKPGKYKVSVLQGSATGGSEMDVILGDQTLNFKVLKTGDFHKHEEVSVGEVEIKAPGTYRLALKPKSKNGGAIMDVKKVVLAPVS